MRFWVISEVGHGTGDTPEEAVEAFVTAQRASTGAHRHLPDHTLVDGLVVRRSPEGFTGFVLTPRLRWTRDGEPNRESSQKEVLGFATEYLKEGELV